VKPQQAQHSESDDQGRKTITEIKLFTGCFDAPLPEFDRYAT
jgi:hypothetical protein